MVDIKLSPAKIKRLIKISEKLEYILSDIPKAMYRIKFEEFLRGCEPDAIENMANTVLDLYSFDISAHCYIWDLNAFKANLKRIKSKNIKKDMASPTYKNYVEQMIRCCYPSACQYIWLMLILNIDYKTDWKDIYNYFLLWGYEPQDREKYRFRQVIRQVKKPKPLLDKRVTRELTFSGYSKCSLVYNLKCMSDDQFQGFIHILCGLQAVREDYNFFDKQLLKKVVDEYWDAEYEKSLTEQDKRALNAWNEIDLLEASLLMVETEKLHKDLEIDGERYYPETDTNRDYDKEIRQLEKQIKEIKQFVEQYEADYDEWIKPIYDGFGNSADIWPTYEQCNALGNSYHHTYDVLLNSIAVLVHTIPKKDWNKIIAYYAINERRIMLAEKPVLDKDSGDPYIIHPKLKRPITDDLIDGLKDHSPTYESITAEQLDNRWEEYRKPFKRQDLMFIVFDLQFKGAELIKQDIFFDVFKRQFESVKNGGPYFFVDTDRINEVLKNIRNDKKYDVRNIAILLDKGYKVEEVGEFFQEKLLKKKSN